MKLISSAFSDGGSIPRRFTCDGEDVSPPLQWSDAPAETHSFALLCDDPDAPAGIWHHWAAYDIPANLTGLPEGAGRSAKDDRFKHATNDFGRAGYGGPCPPRGHGVHHYHFRLLALSVTSLGIHKLASCQDIEGEARKHLITEAALVGVYHR
ncbi:MAG TPA: YbhB/YbcL family Raf kinase inhibitor-like protein [Methylocella sp.]|nr:YbhB/YbcL family Raf kinase inhibitor-like protein [Methylocella sp.]